MAKVTIDDYSAGITDFIFEGKPNQAEICNNLFITKERGLQTRYGSAFYDLNNPRVPAGNVRIGHMVELSNQLFIQALNKMYYLSGGSFNTLEGPNGGQLFTTSTETTYMDSAEWNGHLIVTNDNYEKPIKIFKDVDGDFQLRTAGLPLLESNPTISPQSNDGASYIYRFLRFYEYTVGDLTFQDLSSTTQVEIINAADMSAIGHYNAISNISVLSGENYDSANVKVYVYRTINTGDVFFYVGQVDNGTTTFVDNVTDANLIDRELLYTEGGVYDNDEPPLSKYVVVANDIAWYLNVKELGSTYTYRIRQSIQGDVDSCPTSFYKDVVGEIRGGEEYQNTVVIMTDKRIYRLDGYIDFSGRGEIQATVIHDTAGCLANNSIVKTPSGLFWAGNDGFYWSDGYRVLQISKHLKNTFSSFTNTETKRKKITGTFDTKNNRVIWSVATSFSENDTLFIVDTDYMSQGSHNDLYAPFITMNGGSSFRPTAILFYEDELVRADSRGFIFKHNEDYFSDPEVDLNADPADWDTQQIEYTWKHIAFDYGEADINKWVNKVTLGLQNDSNINILLTSFDDGTNSGLSLKEIEYKSIMTWGDPAWIWGSADAIWGESSLVSKTRRMKKTKIRTRYKQLQISNGLEAEYPKTQRLHLNSITYTYEPLMDKTGGYYKRSEGN